MINVRVLSTLMVGMGGLALISEPCSAQVCGDPNAGDCCVANGTPGCDELGCCKAICAVDPFCCDTAWDGICAGAAIVSPDCSCVAPPGACCFPDGTCQDLDPGACKANGGIPQGAGTNCDIITCPSPEQACCFPDAPCQDLLPADCTALGGTPQGVGTTCAIITCPIPDLISADGAWRAQINGDGVITNFFTPAQPTLDNVFETIIYAASSLTEQLSQRVSQTTGWIVTEGPTVSPDQTRSHTRLENPNLGLSVAVDNQMIPGPNGGVQVRITCENKSPSPLSCKLFYYCDFDISGDFGDDEAGVILNADGTVRAIQQGDNGDPNTKPLWFGGCKPYKSWSIQTFALLRTLLDGPPGIPQLDGADSTVPGPADHTCALSSEKIELPPFSSSSTQFGLGAPEFDGCEADNPCPADFNNDGEVNAADLATLLGKWGPCPGCPSDLSGNGVVNAEDLATLLGAWGLCKKAVRVKLLDLNGPANSGINSARTATGPIAQTTMDCLIDCLTSVYASINVNFVEREVLRVDVPADVDGDGNADFNNDNVLSNAELSKLNLYLYGHGAGGVDRVGTKQIVIAPVKALAAGTGATLGFCAGASDAACALTNSMDNLSFVADGGDCRTFAHEVAHSFCLCHCTMARNIMTDPRASAIVPGEVPPPGAACAGGTASNEVTFSAVHRAKVRAKANDPQQLKESTPPQGLTVADKVVSGQ